MSQRRTVNIADYTYELPAEKIAEVPCRDRSQSRLLRYAAASESVADYRFSDLPELLPHNSLLVMNDTRVVPARIPMQRVTGGRVEVFLIDPVAPSDDPARSLAAGSPTRWRCMVRGLKRIRPDEVLHLQAEAERSTTSRFEAILIDRSKRSALLEFRWTPEDRSFSELLEEIGHVPLPPYIARDARREDRQEYQTIYAREDGAVAAPTAGLHFTEKVFSQLESRGIEIARTTLHVGAGTFAPVTAERAAEHSMHGERFSVSLATIERLAERLRGGDNRSPVVHVGTTTVRTLESLYWIADRGIVGGGADSLADSLDQWYALDRIEEGVGLPEPAEAFAWLAENLRSRSAMALQGTTHLMILPGYRFMTCDHLITNFHQPDSTLILLVAAFLGGDRWRYVYDHALSSGYRFLSFGDSSLLSPPDSDS